MEKIINYLQEGQYIEISKVDNEIDIVIGKYVGFEADHISKSISLEKVEQANFDIVEATIIEMLQKVNKVEYVEDGFGGRWDKKCPECGLDSMHVVRPGKIQCGNCR